MTIVTVIPEENGILRIVTADGREGAFDVKPYFEYEAFEALKDNEEFKAVRHHGYYVDWLCGADRSADTLEAHMVWGDRRG